MVTNLSSESALLVLPTLHGSQKEYLANLSWNSELLVLPTLHGSQEE